MTVDKAVEIMKAVIATKNKKGEVTVKDRLQVSIACTILSQNLTAKEIKKLLKD